MTGITPDDWSREGFLCLCELHLEHFKQSGDAEAEVMDSYSCDMKGCTNDAVYELFPNLTETLKQARKDIKEGNVIPFEDVKEKYLNDEESS